ncbi:MAG TPA: hypothetical protein PK843_14555 [bacterium]|nr:hypothetical protein [bacterium]HPN35734.1 hypothetical protein [bacterium]
MTGYQFLYDEQRRPFLISIGLHALFFLLALFWQIGFNFKPAEFVEVRLSGGAIGVPQPIAVQEQRPSASSRSSEAVRLDKPLVRQPTPPARTTVQPSAKISQPATHPVVPPKRRMLEDEEPQLTNRAEGKLTPELAAVDPNAKLDAAPAASQPGLSAASSSATSVYDREPGLSAASGNRTNGSENAPIGGGQPFAIEGDAAQRTILHQVIPEYPSGLQKEEVLKIRFTLLADGRIGLMIPMRKGDPTLEKITLDALRQWRFNALPASAEQKSVTGIITFRYELQ